MSYQIQEVAAAKDKSLCPVETYGVTNGVNEKIE